MAPYLENRAYPFDAPFIVGKNHVEKEYHAPRRRRQVISAPYLGKVRRREAAGLNLITRVANARHNTLSNASATLWLIGLRIFSASNTPGATR